MNASLVFHSPTSELDEEEIALADQSMRQAHSAIRGNAFLFGALEIFLVLTKHPTPTQQYWLLGGTVLYLLIALWQWNWVKREKFRRVKASSHHWPLVLKERNAFVFQDLMSASPWNIILWISVVLLCAYIDLSDLLNTIPVLIFLFLLPQLIKLGSTLGFRTKIELESDKLKEITTFTFRKKTEAGFDEENVTEEISYADILRVETSKLNSLSIYSGESSMMVSVDLYGVRALATISGAIEKYAPQAKLDTGADLMRRGYFSW
ncbi:MAG TPA: hypothetical protein VGB77_22595 [Abditibacteriaceae bacterium]|jgi:hypothetical protein